MTSSEGKVVLIITKDFREQEHIKDILRKSSLTPISSRNLKTTEKYIIEFTPDLLCIDIATIQEWRIDLFEFLRNVRRIKGDIKIIAIYSYTSQDFLKHCFENGVNDCIKVPFSIYDLNAKILKCLSLISFSNSIDFHGLKLFEKERYIIFNNSKIFLTNKEVLIFHSLFTERREISSKEFSIILNCNISAVRVCINRLQKKLERNTGMKIIKCRYGVGYYIGI